MNLLLRVIFLSAISAGPLLSGCHAQRGESLAPGTGMEIPVVRTRTVSPPCGERCRRPDHRIA